MFVDDIKFEIEENQAIQWIGPDSVLIHGLVNGQRVPSRVLDDWIQNAVQKGARHLKILAHGQHGIGGRIHPTGEKVRIEVYGPTGQRVGGMGMPGTEIVVHGSASDDVGWLNCGANITVLGDVGNGTWNAAAQGILYVQGGGGARCDTLTKHNPRFAPPQSWYFRDVGDSFAEFKAGGIAVVCGVNPRNPESVLGYRPCVGMVGGIIYFRGKIAEYSHNDVRLEPLDDNDWKWLCTEMPKFLKAIDRIEYLPLLTARKDEWRKLVALRPEERTSKPWIPISISEFRTRHWEPTVGKGGIFADYLNHERSILPYVVTGENRLYRPVWANEKYAAPCEFTCPAHIPTQKRTALLRAGRIREAIQLTLRYSPFPVSVCGYICPNPCMQACTRATWDNPVSTKLLGQTSDLEIELPTKAKPTGKKIAIIGGGPAGLSAAWQLAILGYQVSLFESNEQLGGKLYYLIPTSRLPRHVLARELERISSIGIDIHTNTTVTRELFQKIRTEFDAVVVACGAHNPRKLTFPGSEHLVTAYEFLLAANNNRPYECKNKNVAIIGAGNVGMDVACTAKALGANQVTAIDIQKPAAFGTELRLARAQGVQILWPKQVDRYDPQARKLICKDGTEIPADLIICAIGDLPRLDFVPDEFLTERGTIKLMNSFETVDPKVFAIGDVTGLGLATHAIGHGNQVAHLIHNRLSGQKVNNVNKPLIPSGYVRPQFYERTPTTDNPILEANRCLSCGKCRDCHTCENVCYWGAISRREKPDGSFEYKVDDEKCIGCGFCAATCPCGVWEMVPNTPNAQEDTADGID